MNDDLNVWVRQARRQMRREDLIDNICSVLGAIGVLGLAAWILHLAK